MWMCACQFSTNNLLNNGMIVLNRYFPKSQRDQPSSSFITNSPAAPDACALLAFIVNSQSPRVANAMKPDNYKYQKWIHYDSKFATRSISFLQKYTRWTSKPYVAKSIEIWAVTHVG